MDMSIVQLCRVAAGVDAGFGTDVAVDEDRGGAVHLDDFAHGGFEAFARGLGDVGARCTGAGCCCCAG